MRVPSMVWIRPYMQAIGLLIAGGVIGGAVFMSVYQHNFDLLYIENQRLRTENDDLHKTLEPYLKDKNRPSLVRQLKINIASPIGADKLDEVTSTELRRALQSDLETLRGRTTQSATDNMLVVKRIIDRKIYTLRDNQEFSLELQLVVFKGDTLTIWAEARPFLRSD